MTQAFDSEIKEALAGALGRSLGVPFSARSVRMPARQADASAHLPPGAGAAQALCADFGALCGAQLVARVRLVNGWLLFDFTGAFLSALVSRVNASLPLPADFGSAHEANRMLVLSRHGGEGCPDLPAFRRALLEAVCAHQSRAAYARAACAAETLFHTIPPRERPALMRRCGALGGALARLLNAAERADFPVSNG